MCCYLLVSPHVASDSNNCETFISIYVSLMITKDTLLRAKVAKICNNMSKSNQNWCLKL